MAFDRYLAEQARQPTGGGASYSRIA